MKSILKQIFQYEKSFQLANCFSNLFFLEVFFPQFSDYKFFEIY